MMLAEWARQDGILMAWPHENTDWQNNLLDAQQCYLEIIACLLSENRILLLCPDQFATDAIRQQLGKAYPQADISQLLLSVHSYNDTWTRDYGPVGSRWNNHLQLLDFQFNAWGNKYRSDQDNTISYRLYRDNLLSVKPTVVDFVLEGGSVETDGQGTLLVTERCLLSRNRRLSKPEIEAQLKQTLHVSRIFWLKNGYLAGDDTDGHIDTLVRFCSPTNLAYTSCECSANPNYAGLRMMEEELTNWHQSSGCSYELTALPSPQLMDKNGSSIPASYTNFLITNTQVLVPLYQDPNDTIALQRLTQAFPSRRVVGIDCRALIQQYGSLHCITMQLPQHSLGYFSEMM